MPRRHSSVQSSLGWLLQSFCFLFHKSFSVLPGEYPIDVWKTLGASGSGIISRLTFQVFQQKRRHLTFSNRSQNLTQSLTAQLLFSTFQEPKTVSLWTISVINVKLRTQFHRSRGKYVYMRCWQDIKFIFSVLWTEFKLIKANVTHPNILITTKAFHVIRKNQLCIYFKKWKELGHAISLCKVLEAIPYESYGAYALGIFVTGNSILFFTFCF